MRFLPILALLLLSSSPGGAQVSTAPTEGLRDGSPRTHALTGATVWISPKERIEAATIVIRDGLIVEAGQNVPVPADARIWDMTGRFIYAGFIDAAADLGSPKNDQDALSHWNPLVHPERRASEFTPPDKATTSAHRALGFAAAHVVPGDPGIFRGRTGLLNLHPVPSPVPCAPRQTLAFNTLGDSYPASLMGTLALIRQTYLDADWYAKTFAYQREHPVAERPAANKALASLAEPSGLLGVTTDELDAARFENLAREFALPDLALLGNGREYRHRARLGAMKARVILPLAFPETPRVEDPSRALDLSLESLEHWEYAPSNAAILAAEGIPICLTPRGLAKPEETFWTNVRIAVTRGLAPEAALAALTTEPAALAGVSDRLGSLAPDLIANITIADHDLFTDPHARILSVWIDGRPYETDAAGTYDLRGKWVLAWRGVNGPAEWEVTGKIKTPTLKVGDDEIPLKIEGAKIFLFPSPAAFGSESEGAARLVGHFDPDKRTLEGAGELPGGAPFSWTAIITPSVVEDGDETADEIPNPSPFAKYPAGAFGLSAPPFAPPILLIRNATVWTSGPQGRLEAADVLIRAGKIITIGQNVVAPEGAHILDATGKHLTPGLIDCHSHSAISRGFNEGTHSVTVEVRVGDVVDPTDIALYRELAGGLTTANLLHGSANPMGGQNQVIKLRWGGDADALRFEGAKPGVKFALGENVKRANWNDRTNRYPRSRLGVPQIMRDTFMAARKYESERAEAAAAGRPHRRDLLLESTLEMLKRERIIHIHSYRQDEILAFIAVAKEFNLEVGTFQHILEGYKVADAIAAIGAGASSFSDWWAYKVEVYDAIPHNGAMLHDAGIVTSFNSDSNELATRLNTEAAKAVKFGGLSEEEALKFVTLNPARQLRIDARVGSLEPGKDADFVIWSAHPLSGFARAEQTWIDGKRYFDLDTDRQLQDFALAERERLVALALPKRMKALAKKKKLEEVKTDGSTNDASTPRTLLPFASLSECLSSRRRLYHDGSSGHTCSTTDCCGR
jgi:imidazolonepropionase-like amidohydrolase